MLPGDGTQLLTPLGRCFFEGKTNPALGELSLLRGSAPSPGSAFVFRAQRCSFPLCLQGGGPALAPPRWGGLGLCDNPCSGCRVRVGGWGNPPKSSWGACPVAEGGRGAGCPPDHPTHSATPPAPHSRALAAGQQQSRGKGKQTLNLGLKNPLFSDKKGFFLQGLGTGTWFPTASVKHRPVPHPAGTS